MQLIQKGHEGSSVDVLDAIYNRRATRSFSKKQVGVELVEELLTAATHAPSAMNQQPWAFTVIQDRSVLDRINISAKDFLLKSQSWQKTSEHALGPLADSEFDVFYGASTLIVISARMAGFESIGDSYLAGQTLMLAACGLGLATCPIGFARDVLKTKPLCKELQIPVHYAPVLPIIVGYSSGTKLASPPRNPPRITKWIKADERT
jgi:nitroreductase